MRVPVTNTVTGTATWDPVDGRDAIVSVSDSDTDIIQARSIAIQKSNAVVTDAQAAGPTPEDIYEFTLQVQVSDYFTFGDLLVTDILGNGWDYLEGTAELSFSEEAGSGGPISLDPFETSVFDGGTGETTNTWDVSAAIGGDGLLTGDIAGDGFVFRQPDHSDDHLSGADSWTATPAPFPGRHNSARVMFFQTT